MTTTKTDVGAHVNGVVAAERELAAPERDCADWSVIPDPEPIEDEMQQHDTTSSIYKMIGAHFPDMPDTLVTGGGYLAWNPDNIRGNNLVPDCMVAFGVNPKEILERNGYLIWEVGKPPDVVIEVASPSTKDRDLNEKRDRYALLGISEYWRLDPSGGKHYGEPIVGEYLADGEYRRYEMRVEDDGRVWGYSGVMGINLCWDGARFITQDPETGRYMIGYIEAQELLEARDRAIAAAEAYAAQVERERDEALARASNAEVRAETAEAQLAQERQAHIQEQRARQAAEAEIARLRGQR